MQKNTRFATSFFLASLTMTGIAFGQSGVLGDGNPDLIYNPVDGTVVFDAEGDWITSFALEREETSPDFFVANTNFAGLPDGITDNVASTIGWVSFTSFTGQHELGSVFPTGLRDVAALDGYLKTAIWGRDISAGGGGGALGLRLVPEPASLGWTGCCILAIGFLRKRARRVA